MRKTFVISDKAAQRQGRRKPGPQDEENQTVNKVQGILI